MHTQIYAAPITPAVFLLHAVFSLKQESWKPTHAVCMHSRPHPRCPLFCFSRQPDFHKLLQNPPKKSRPRSLSILTYEPQETLQY
jgi:hypothetical protein